MVLFIKQRITSLLLQSDELSYTKSNAKRSIDRFYINEQDVVRYKWKENISATISKQGVL